MKTLTFLIVLIISVLSVLNAQSQFYFTANPNNPVLSPTGQEAWDDGGVFTPHIQFSNGTYYLFYAGWYGQFGNQISIGLASSEDGFNFAKLNTDEPLLSSDGTGFDALAVADPVLLFKEQWIMYYAGVKSASNFLPTAIGRATSASVDGPYTRDENPVLEIGSPGEWDSYFIHPSSVIHHNGQYLMYYWAGDVYPGGKWHIGLATSTDGITWSKYDDPSTTESPFAESDPILKTGESGNWDENRLIGCSVLKTENGFEMFYSGIQENNGAAIGYASSTNGISWTKDEANNPAFSWANDPYAVSKNNWVIEIPTVVYNESVYHVYYDYGLVLAEIGMATALSDQNIIRVPEDHASIQKGIDAASDGFLVIVDEGTYYENIRFKGKAISVASNYIVDGDSSHIYNTVIDGSQPAQADSAACVMFVNGEDTTSVIRGFTLTGGSGVFYDAYSVKAGGGVYAYNSGFKVINNNITENHVIDSDKAGAPGIASIQDISGSKAIIRHNYVGYNTSLSNGFSAFGGGLAITSSCLIEKNIIEHNNCTNTGGAADGGGIELEAFPGIEPEAVVKYNIIQNNRLNATDAAFGGGISCYGFKDLEITDNLIKENILTSDTRSVGAGIWIRETSKMMINENTIIGNEAKSPKGAWGGGLYVYDSEDIYVMNNTFSFNKCLSDNSNAGGGGINILKSGKTWIDHNEVSENTVKVKIGSNYWGGGILIDKPSDTVHINKNQILNNNLGMDHSGHGGGMSFYCTDTVPVYITSNIISGNNGDYRGGGLCGRNLFHTYIQNNLFKNNYSYRYGGAIMLFESGKEESSEFFHPVIVNNNFIDNDAEYGGAIYSRLDEEVPVIFNSLFCNNTAEYSPDIYHIGGSGPAVYYNLIDTTAIFTQWVGDNNIYCEPGLRSDSLHLEWESQCVNAGITMLSFNDSFFVCPEVDIDNEIRPYEGTMPDIGADETESLYVNINTPTESTSHQLITFPNPFTTSTTIEYELTSPSSVQLIIYDYLGKQVDRMELQQSNGKQQITWNAKGRPAGVYTCVLKSKSGTQTVKMIKLK